MEQPTSTREVPRSAFQLSAIPIALREQDQSGLRKFSGVVNNGKPMPHDYWGTLTLDLANARLEPVTGGLVDHDGRQRAATGRLSVSNGTLVVDGNLLSNEFGQAVGKDADEGFPWQMSVFADPGEVVELKPGATAMVNGNQVTGPGTIFRDLAFPEFSFTTVGVDRNTGIQVLSDGAGGPTVTIQVSEASVEMANSDDTKTIESLTAEINGYKQKLSVLNAELDAERQRADTAETALAEQRQLSRSTEVKAYLSAKGVEITDDAMKPYCAMSDDVWLAIQAEGTALLARAQSGNPGQKGTGLPRSFFTGEDAGGNGQNLSQGEPLIIQDARRRAQAAKSVA